MGVILSNIKTKLGSIVSSALSAVGVSGSGATAVCQTTCSATSGIGPLLGISLAATPFSFLKVYHLPIWWIALTLFLVVFYFYLRARTHTKMDTVLLLLNAGLLIIGMPYFYRDCN